MIANPSQLQSLPQTSVKLTTYHFDGATVKKLNEDQVFNTTTLSGQVVVLKAEAGRNAFSALVAERTGIRTPQYRHPSETELTDLKNASPLLKSIKSHWYLMDFITGQNLDQLAVQAFRGKRQNSLSSTQLKDLGASIAFQILLDGWDRWNMPYSGAAWGRYNMGNIMVNGNSHITMIDSDLQNPRRNPDSHRQEVRFYVQKVFTEANGGIIIQNAIKRLQENAFEIGDAEAQDLKTGFVDYVRSLWGMDFSDLDGSIAGKCGEARMAALQEMKTLLADQVELAMETYSKEPAHMPHAHGKKNSHSAAIDASVTDLPNDCEESAVLRGLRDGYRLAHPGQPQPGKRGGLSLNFLRGLKR